MTLGWLSTYLHNGQMVDQANATQEGTASPHTCCINGQRASSFDDHLPGQEAASSAVNSVIQPLRSTCTHSCWHPINRA